MRASALATLALGVLTACAGCSTAPDGLPVQLDIEGWDLSSRLSPGGRQQLRAVITLATGSHQVVDATWQTSDPTVATVAPNGMVTGVGVGTAKIFATYREMTSWRGIFVSICGPSDWRIVRPETASEEPWPTHYVTVGRSIQLSTKGYDGCVRFDVSVFTVWQTPDPGIVKVTPEYFLIQDPAVGSPAHTATITGLAPGIATIVTSSGERQKTARVVVLAVPPDVRLVDSLSTMRVGTGQQLRAVVSYPDGYSRDVTNSVLLTKWSSSDPATVGVESGRVWAYRVGVATISATFEGVTGSLEVTVVRNS
jgi:hypothetical protein